MRFAWFILIYCLFVNVFADSTTTVHPTIKNVSSNNQTSEVVIVIPLDNVKINNQTSAKQSNRSTKIGQNFKSSTNLITNSLSSLNSTNQQRSSTKNGLKNDLLSALPSTSSLVATQIKYNKPNREIRPEIVHKSIPIQVK